MLAITSANTFFGILTAQFEAIIFPHINYAWIHFTLYVHYSIDVNTGFHLPFYHPVPSHCKIFSQCFAILTTINNFFKVLNVSWLFTSLPWFSKITHKSTWHLLFISQAFHHRLWCSLSLVVLFFWGSFFFFRAPSSGYWSQHWHVLHCWFLPRTPTDLQVVPPIKITLLSA